MSEPAAAAGRLAMNPSFGTFGRGAMTPLMYRITSRVEETDDTASLTMEPVGEAIPHPRPGQFTMLWAFGIGEAPISLAGREDDRLTHTVRGVGTVTRAIQRMAPGDEIGVRGPFGVGWDLDRAKGGDVLVVAGGLGVAPVRPIVEQVLSSRDDYRRLAVLIGARSPDELLYPADLDRWAERDDVDVEVTVDTASSSWRGDVGLVTQLLGRAPVDMSATTTYVCGPEIMMRFVARGVLDLGCAPSETFVSLERNMHCAIGHCGHCQLGPAFICRDGPVIDWATVEPLLAVVAR